MEANKHNSQGKTIVSYRLVQVNQSNKTPSALETPFSFESLFSDQRMTLTFRLSHFDYTPYSVIRNVRMSVKQQQQRLRLTPFRMSQWRYKASLETLILGLLETIKWGNNIAYTA